MSTTYILYYVDREFACCCKPKICFFGYMQIYYWYILSWDGNMKQLGHVLFWIAIVCIVPLMGNAQLISPDINTTILNKNLNQTVNTDLTTDPLRDGVRVIINDGTNNPWGSVDNIIWSNQWWQISSFANAKNRVINIINVIMNYTLGLLALVALVYLMYHGFMMVTAAGDEERYNKWFAGIRYAAIALAGIGLSWFVVSLIFYIIDFIIS